MSEPMLLPSPPTPPSRNGRLFPGEVAPRQYFDSPPGAPQADDSESPLFSTLRLLRRHKGILVLGAALGTIAGVLYTLPQIPIYQATATIEIQGINSDFLNMHNLSETAAPMWDPMTEIQTQIREMQSKAVRDRVIKKMTALGQAPMTTPTGRLSAWRKVLHLGDTTPPTLEDAVDATGLSIKASLTSRIVDISCDSIDPQVAAKFANTVAEEYIQENLESRWKSTQDTEKFLNLQIEELRIKLAKSEDELQSYMNNAGLMLISGEKEKENVAEEKLRQLQQAVVKAKEERVDKESRFGNVKSSASESLPEVLDDKTQADYKRSLAELRKELADMNVNLAPGNPKVKHKQAQVESLEESMKKARTNITERLANEYESALRREKMLDDDYTEQKKVVADQASKLVHYNMLKREVDTDRQIFQTMLERVKESSIVSAMKASGIRIVDLAEPPGGPYKPDTRRTAVVGMFFGLFLGGVFIMLRDRANRDLQQPGDTSFYLNVPELGVIPAFASDPALRQRVTRAATADSTSPDQDAVELVTWNRKFSLLAEAFRSMLTSVLFSGHNGSQPRIIVLTSANPSEGKTTVTINLAIALAEINQRVLLIDADMRRPRLQNLFNLGAGPGLADLLREKTSPNAPLLEGAVCQTSIPGLYVIRSGRSSGIVSNLLHSSRLPELLDRLRNEFDTVVIDTPPVLHISDARVIGRLADAVLLIVRAGVTTRDAAILVKQRFGEDGTQILGTILNGWDPKRHDSYKYHYYNGTAAQYYRKDAGSDQS